MITVYNNPIAYGYTRVSHALSFQKGESLPAQRDRIERYYNMNLAPQGIGWGGTHNDEKNISAYRVQFTHRPAGRKLMDLMKPGDHLILDKPDRIWRSMRDFVNLMHKLENLDITVHIVSFMGISFTNSSPAGKFMLQQFVALAELESAVKSERITQALDVNRSRARHASCALPGTKLVTSKDRKQNGKHYRNLVWDDDERELMDFILNCWHKIYTEKNYNWRESTHEIEEWLAKREGRDPRKLNDRWHEDKRWAYLCRAERAYRYLGVREPSQIPKRVQLSEAARQYRREYMHKLGRVSKIPVITPDQILTLTKPHG